MSATAASLTCPICAHAGVFDSVQSLRDRLIYVSTNKMLCPVCQEEVVGLDKLTIHLFSHVKLLTSKNYQDKQGYVDNSQSPKENKQASIQQKKTKSGAAKRETPYACSQCNKTFTFQQSYHKHLLYHNDEKPHTCNFCGRAFKELSTLHNHQRIHTGEKPFSCETCGKSFRQRVSYLVHRRIHTGVMPYKCTACEKSFRYKVSQRTHKCPAKPPGIVIRQSGDLVEKLKKKNKDPDSILPESYNNTLQYSEVSEANAALVRSGAKLSLEDMESDSFKLISEPFIDNINIQEDNISDTSYPIKPAVGENNSSVTDDILNSNIEDLIDSLPMLDKNVPSPSEILKNLCLSQEDNYSGNILDQNSEKPYDLYKVFNDFM
ncbi:oocyte zinc finger protein XlCOF28 isoform X2 [Plodia interpunctella]|uniref:oocyte zinc finger protein XlCOF28 isoform X2 n=1 Tax=Plodia interpunctella TaxID=58824 RepID=UPI00236822F2|nr:oocyte zinc finger protein XlCOF28 isoform X2 [Plodia interpunctella]